MRRAGALAMLVMALAGCQRGCLSTWLREHGFGGELPTSPVPKATEAPCPDGLARCRDGAVFVSQAFTPPSPCSPEGCRCPWDKVAACARGCVVEGLEMEIARENAAKQLCAPEPAAAPGFARAVPLGARAEDLAPSDAASGEVVEAFCEVERYHCARGVVHRCDSGQAKPLAICERGCIDGEGLIVEEIPTEAATALLCVR